jgi:hypothetical protein
MVGSLRLPKIAQAAQLLIKTDNFTAKDAFLVTVCNISAACSLKAHKTGSKSFKS